MADQTKSNRCSVNFPAGVFTDYFLSSPSHPIDVTKNEEQHQKLKEEVNKMLMGAVDKPWTKLDLIDAVQRLGVSYHFKEKIDDILLQMYGDAKDNEDDHHNLYTTSLGFRLLRQHGYKISCEMFKKFKDDQGKFKESLKSDVRGMLSLYEATHLRIHGEDILEEALAFTTNHLEMILQSDNLINPSVSAQIRHALNLPLHKNAPRLEAKYYISVYEQDPSHSEILLTFAKLDFNILQKQHQTELCNLSRWWADLDVSNKIPFARSDRIAESYFWIMVACFEPQHFLGRKTCTKVINVLTILDDFYDAYGYTPDQLELLTEAIERWDVSAADNLPDEYMKVYYKELLLPIYKEIGEEVIAQGELLYWVQYAKTAKILMARAYLKEAKWLYERRVPTMKEYMEVGLITSGIPLLCFSCLVGFGNSTVTKHVFDWILTYPKLITACAVIYRFMGDIGSHEFEKERGHEATSIHCYMKQYGVTKQEAIAELYRQISNAWKDINEEYCLLKQFINVPFPILTQIINLTRVVHILYKDGDAYTFSQQLLKNDMAALLVYPVPLSEM